MTKAKFWRRWIETFARIFAAPSEADAFAAREDGAVFQTARADKLKPTARR